MKLQNRRYIAVLLLGIGTILSNLLINLASNMLPAYWKPSWPFFLFFLVVSIVLFCIGYLIWQNHIEQNDISSIKSTNPSRERTGLSGAHKQNRPVVKSLPSTDEYDLKLTQAYSAPQVVSNPANSVPLLDTIDIYEDKVIDEPLPKKSPGVSEASAREEIPSLPPLEVKRRFSVDLPKYPTMLYWSPDGACLACTFVERPPVVLNLNTGDRVNVQALGTVQAICWSPDSQVIAMSIQGTVHFWDIRTQSPWVQPLPVSARPIYGLDWSVRGELGVWVGDQIQVYTITIKNRYQPALSYTLPMTNLQCDSPGMLRWSHNGLFLAAGATAGKSGLVCWRVNIRTAQQLASGQRVYSLGWSPNSFLLEAAFRDKSVTGWNVLENRKVTEWRNLPVVLPVMLSISTEQRLVLASREQYLLFGRFDEQAPSATVPGQKLVAWSPKSQLLATLDVQKENALLFLEV